MSALLLAACCVERTWGELFFYLDLIFGQGCREGVYHFFFFSCLCSFSKRSPENNYFQRFQSREEKKRLSLTAQCFLKVWYMFWYEIMKLRKGLQSSSTWSNCQKFANSMQGTCALTLVREKKIKYFSFSLWLCVFICVQLRVEAISLPPPAFCCLLVGPPFTKTLWTASGWLKHSQSTQWRYTLTGLCLKDNIQVCLSLHIRFKILRLFSFASKSLLKIEIFTKEKKHFSFVKTQSSN